MLEEQEVISKCQQENRLFESERDEYKSKEEHLSSLSEETAKENKEVKKKLTTSLTEAVREVETAQKGIVEAEHQNAIRTTQNEKIRRELETAQQELAKSNEGANYCKNNSTSKKRTTRKQSTKKMPWN